jgi:hypothetical protein
LYRVTRRLKIDAAVQETYRPRRVRSTSMIRECGWQFTDKVMPGLDI